MKGQKKNPPWLEKEDRLLKENIQLKIVEKQTPRYLPRETCAV